MRCVVQAIHLPNRGPIESDDDAGDETSYQTVKQKQNKVLLVPLAHAIVNPGTVVVHFTNAAVANATVIRSRWTPHFATLNKTIVKKIDNERS